MSTILILFVVAVVAFAVGIFVLMSLPSATIGKLQQRSSEKDRRD